MRGRAGRRLTVPCPDAWLIERIATVHDENRGVYGSRRVQAELRLGGGLQVSRKRVQRLVRAACLSGLVARKRGRTTIRVPGFRVADDLVERRFRPDRPDVLWSLTPPVCGPGRAGSTWPPSEDAYIRRIVGWSMADHMRAELVVDALEMAQHRRRPHPGLICHSDQGSQFVSLAFGQGPRRRHRRLDGLQRLCLHQCRRRELLRDAQDGTPASTRLARADNAAARRPPTAA